MGSRIVFVISVLAGICLVLLTATPVRADVSCAQQSNEYAKVSTVTYFQKTLDAPDARCDRGTAKKGKCTAKLKGRLYVPKEPGDAKHKYPVVVWNHGSGSQKDKDGKASPNDLCIAWRFVKEHFSRDKSDRFVFFAPWRRGVAESTGEYAAGSDLIEQYGEAIGEAVLGPLLDDSTKDVQAAVDFVKTVPEVDAGEIAVMGHSYGGMVSLFSAVRVSGIKAAVDSSGGALSWNANEHLQKYMIGMVPQVRVPTLLMQDNQECSMPTAVLAKYMPPNGSKAIIYPFSARDCGKKGAHSDFMHEEGIKLWFDDVMSFFARSGVAP